MRRQENAPYDGTAPKKLYQKYFSEMNIWTRHRNMVKKSSKYLVTQLLLVDQPE